MLHSLTALRALAVVVVCAAALAAAASAHAAGWISATSPTTNGLYGIDCATSNHCVGVGDAGTIVYNKGERTTWLAATSGISSILNNVDVYSTVLAIAVGNSGVILRSTDNGETWAAVTSGTTEDLFAVKMGSSTVGWAVGDNDTILETADGGQTWSAATASPPTIDALAVDAISTSVVWIAGKNGAVFRSSNSGTSWTDVSISTANNFYTIDAVSSSTAYVGGSNRSLHKTTDSGSNWSALLLTDFGATEAVADLAFYTTSGGTAGGNAGTIASTTDGSTFSADTSTVSMDGVYDVATVAVGSRFAVGADGAIAIYDNYGPNAPENLAMENGEYTNDRTPTLTWDAATDDEGADMSHYELSVDEGTTWDDIGVETSYTFASNIALGVWTMQVRAVDEVGNEGSAAEVTFAIEQTDPTVGTLAPTSATTGTSTEFYTTATDASGIASCALYINSAYVGDMTYDSAAELYSYSHTFTSSGSYSAYAYCEDEAGNTASGSTATVTVTGEDVVTDDDTTAPTIGSVSPTTATEDEEATFTAEVSDDVGISSCYLYVSGSSAGSMTVSGDTASKDYTFTSSGEKSVYVKCYDDAGNAGSGSAVTVTVEDSGEEATEAEAGDLVKLACDDDSDDVNDPCRAVYYVGEDGARHAFPNENVYFTWYDDFDDVIVVTDDYLASLSLGANVTYHPGTTMVKFITVNTVYAVGEDGELRAIDSEETAASIWGDDWNQQIDDISDAFYGNYEFGDDIDSTSDFDPDEVEDSVGSIDEIL